VIERQRRPGEIDRFRWFCPRCDAPLHEEKAEVHDDRADQVRTTEQVYSIRTFLVKS
jgi:3-hydroxyanthranilate 3,4-dioxygenase